MMPRDFASQSSPGQESCVYDILPIVDRPIPSGCRICPERQDGKVIFFFVRIDENGVLADEDAVATIEIDSDLPAEVPSKYASGKITTEVITAFSEKCQAIIHNWELLNKRLHPFYQLEIPDHFPKELSEALSLAKTPTELNRLNFTINYLLFGSYDLMTRLMDWLTAKEHQNLYAKGNEIADATEKILNLVTQGLAHWELEEQLRTCSVLVHRTINLPYLGSRTNDRLQFKLMKNPDVPAADADFITSLRISLHRRLQQPVAITPFFKCFPSAMPTINATVTTRESKKRADALVKKWKQLSARLGVLSPEIPDSIPPEIKDLLAAVQAPCAPNNILFTISIVSACVKANNNNDLRFHALFMSMLSHVEEKLDIFEHGLNLWEKQGQPEISDKDFALDNFQFDIKKSLPEKNQYILRIVQDNGIAFSHSNFSFCFEYPSTKQYSFFPATTNADIKTILSKATELKKHYSALTAIERSRLSNYLTQYYPEKYLLVIALFESLAANPTWLPQYQSKQEFSNAILQLIEQTLVELDASFNDLLYLTPEKVLLSMLGGNIPKNNSYFLQQSDLPKDHPPKDTSSLYSWSYFKHHSFANKLNSTAYHQNHHATVNGALSFDCVALGIGSLRRLHLIANTDTKTSDIVYFFPPYHCLPYLSHAPEKTRDTITNFKKRASDSLAQWTALKQRLNNLTCKQIKSSFPYEVAHALEEARIPHEANQIEFVVNILQQPFSNHEFERPTNELRSKHLKQLDLLHGLVIALENVETKLSYIEQGITIWEKEVLESTAAAGQLHCAMFAAKRKPSEQYDEAQRKKLKK